MKKICLIILFFTFNSFGIKCEDIIESLDEKKLKEYVQEIRHKMKTEEFYRFQFTAELEKHPVFSVLGFDQILQKKLFNYYDDIVILKAVELYLEENEKTMNDFQLMHFNNFIDKWKDNLPYQVQAREYYNQTEVKKRKL